MANQFRKNNGWSQYGIVALIAIVLMVVDARTTWLSGPRNILAVAVSPIQFLASIPARTGAFISGVLSVEPNVKIAYENLRNEYAMGADDRSRFNAISGTDIKTLALNREAKPSQ